MSTENFIYTDNILFVSFSKAGIDDIWNTWEFSPFYALQQKDNSDTDFSMDFVIFTTQLYMVLEV